MKLVCIIVHEKMLEQLIWRKRLTRNKNYYVIEQTNENYLIINDDNFEAFYNKKLFKKLSEIRNEKINKLLE